MRGCVAALGLLPLALGPMACAHTADPREPEAAVRGFLRHFENLEWEPFLASFTPDACVFHPSARTPQAFCGPELAVRWRQVFDETRAAAASGPPYLRLDPQALRVTPLGPDAPLVTFELHAPERFARRTVVLTRRDGQWRIRHLHASNVPWPDSPGARP
jgi:ketosteroid isomerase-like protein